MITKTEREDFDENNYDVNGDYIGDVVDTRLKPKEITNVEINEFERTSYSILFSILTISTIVMIGYIALSFSYVVSNNFSGFTF